MAEKWKKVERGKGKGLPVKKTTKPEQQNTNLPVAEFADPLAPSETSFGSFAEIQEQRQHRDVENFGSTSKKHAPRARRRQEKEVRKEVTLEEALQQVDVDELSAQLEVSRVRFTSYPIVWLKDIASKLRSQLLIVRPESDPLLPDKASNYPLCEVDDDLYALLSELFDELELDTVQQFYRYLLEQLIECSRQGVQTYGLRILLQALLQTRPDISGHKLQEEVSGMLKRQVGHVKCLLTLLWALGQMPNGSWSLPLRMWVHCVLPLVFKAANKPLPPNIQQHIVRHFNSTVSAMKDEFKTNKFAVAKEAAAVVDVEQFIVLQHVIFVDKQLTAKLHEEFLQVYPDLKAVIFLSQPKNQFRNFFPFLLANLQKPKSDYQTEVLSCLVDCLCEDEHCLAVWRQTQVKRLKQSMILIEYVKKRWSEVKRKIPREALQETINHLILITEDNEQEEGIERGRQAALFLQGELCDRSVLPAQGFAWTLKAIFWVTIALCTIDVSIHRGLRDSFLWKVLDSNGLLVVFQTGLQSMWNAMLPVLSWLAYHIPLYTSTVVNKCWPSVIQFLRFLAPYWAALSSQGSNIASWVYSNLPQLLFIMRQAIVLIFVQLSDWVYRLASFLGNLVA